MVEVLGRLRTPRLPAAPASPVEGEMYYDTVTHILYFWNGSTWTSQAPGSSVPLTDDSKVSIIRSSHSGGEIGFSVATEIYATSTGDLRQLITPAANVWWRVEFWFIVRVTDAVWREVEADMWLDQGTQTSDALGQTKTPKVKVMHHSGTAPWNSGRAVGLFKLEAGKSYSARPVITPVTGAWAWYTLSAYLGTLSHIAGYW